MSARCQLQCHSSIHSCMLIVVLQVIFLIIYCTQYNAPEIMQFLTHASDIVLIRTTVFIFCLGMASDTYSLGTLLCIAIPLGAVAVLSILILLVLALRFSCITERIEYTQRAERLARMGDFRRSSDLKSPRRRSFWSVICCIPPEVQHLPSSKHAKYRGKESLENRADQKAHNPASNAGTAAATNAATTAASQNTSALPEATAQTSPDTGNNLRHSRHVLSDMSNMHGSQNTEPLSILSSYPRLPSVKISGKPNNAQQFYERLANLPYPLDFQAPNDDSAQSSSQEYGTPTEYTPAPPSEYKPKSQNPAGSNRALSAVKGSTPKLDPHTSLGSKPTPPAKNILRPKLVTPMSSFSEARQRANATEAIPENWPLRNSPSLSLAKKDTQPASSLQMPPHFRQSDGSLQSSMVGFPGQKPELRDIPSKEFAPSSQRGDQLGLVYDAASFGPNKDTPAEAMKSSTFQTRWSEMRPNHQSSSASINKTSSRTPSASEERREQILGMLQRNENILDAGQRSGRQEFSAGHAAVPSVVGSVVTSANEEPRLSAAQEGQDDDSASYGSTPEDKIHKPFVGDKNVDQSTLKSAKDATDVERHKNALPKKASESATANPEVILRSPLMNADSESRSSTPSPLKSHKLEDFGMAHGSRHSASASIQHDEGFSPPAKPEEMAQPHPKSSLSTGDSKATSSASMRFPEVFSGARTPSVARASVTAYTPQVPSVPHAPSLVQQQPAPVKVVGSPENDRTTVAKSHVQPPDNTIKRNSAIAYGEQALVHSTSKRAKVDKAKRIHKPLPSTPFLLEEGVIANLRGEKHEVLYAYQANLSDELDLTPGDILRVFEVFDDGWCLARVARSSGTFRNISGVCPRSCLSQNAVA